MPGQTEVVPEIVPGVDGLVNFEILSVFAVLLPPQLVATTLNVPDVNELVNDNVRLVVPCPETMVEFAGTVHV